MFFFASVCLDVNSNIIFDPSVCIDPHQFGIRGVMVDAAREYLPLAMLKKYVRDLFCLFVGVTKLRP